MRGYGFHRRLCEMGNNYNPAQNETQNREKWESGSNESR